MATRKRFALNVGMNWISMAVGMVVPFFLTPFVVRHLGTDAYGVWILAVSTVSYLNLLDLGLRSAIIRYVSKGKTEGKDDEAQSAIGAALWFRLLVAAGVAGLSVALAFAFPHLFKIPHDLQHAAQITVLLCAFGVAISLVAGVFGGVLSAISRFDILSSITIGQTLARAIGVILILRSGRGLISLAYWELTVILLCGLTTCFSALKLYPACRVRLGRPDLFTLKKIWAYSFKTFIIIVAVQIVFYTDNLVVGAFLSVGAVALYSIAGSLALYSGQVASAMGATFIPMASSLDAAGRSQDLQKLLLRGTQASLGLMLPISLTLLLRGKTFIALWMGPQFDSKTSGVILEILLLSQFFTIANATAGQIAYGVDKHKKVALWAAVEAVFNLALSIVLVKTVRIYGVAWGTSISQAIIHLIFWPRYVKKELGVPIRRYLWEGWTKITLCSIPFGVACVIADRYWYAGKMVVYFAQVLALLPIYALTVMAVFHEEVGNLFMKWKASRSGAPATIA
jgi:O-antigen/teichoic acid export membrane protein